MYFCFCQQEVCGNDDLFSFFLSLYRTDNAVKNQFSTLCKKRAKHEALAKENNTTSINLNNKRVIVNDGLNIDGVSDTVPPYKKIRYN